MEATTEQWELFPLLATAAPAKSKFRQWMDALAVHGPLLTQSLAASALEVSKQRVHQLINDGRIEVVTVGDERFIPTAAIEKYMASKRGPGMRRNTRFGFGTIISEASRIADEIVGK